MLNDHTSPKKKPRNVFLVLVSHLLAKTTKRGYLKMDNPFLFDSDS